MGASRITTRNNKEKIVWAIIDAGYHIARACKVVGIHRSTYYRWLREDAEFRNYQDEVFRMEDNFQDSLHSDWWERQYQLLYSN